MVRAVVAIYLSRSTNRLTPGSSPVDRQVIAIESNRTLAPRSSFGGPRGSCHLPLEPDQALLPHVIVGVVREVVAIYVSSPNKRFPQNFFGRPTGSCHLPLEPDRASLPEWLLAFVDVEDRCLDLVAEVLRVLASHALGHLLHGNRPDGHTAAQ